MKKGELIPRRREEHDVYIWRNLWRYKSWLNNFYTALVTPNQAEDVQDISLIIYM